MVSQQLSLVISIAIRQSRVHWHTCAKSPDGFCLLHLLRHIMDRKKIYIDPRMTSLSLPRCFSRNILHPSSRIVTRFNVRFYFESREKYSQTQRCNVQQIKYSVDSKYFAYIQRCVRKYLKIYMDCSEIQCDAQNLFSRFPV